MPTVLKIGPYRFFFYSGDRGEPIHIHVERNDMNAKFWLDPVMLHHSEGFSRIEIGRILKIISNHQQKFMEAWYEYFGE